MNLLGFINWWLDELSGMLPDSVGRLLRTTDQALIVHLQSDEITRYGMASGRQDQYSDSGQLDSFLVEQPPCPLQVVIPDDEVLKRELVLPAAARENLQEVLIFEMDRQTPFQASQVVFTHRIAGVSDDRKLITVELMLFPRDKVMRALQRFAGWQLDVDAVRMTDKGMLLSLLPQGQVPGKSGILYSMPVLLILALLVAVIAMPFISQQARLDALDIRLDELKQRASQQQLDGRAVTDDRAIIELVASHYGDKSKALALINELSRLLPDTTWLNQLEIDANSVSLRGFSAEASTLIATIESSPLFRNVRFSSPITLDRKTNKEIFQIGADVVRISQ